MIADAFQRASDEHHLEREVDQLRLLNRWPIEIPFSGKPNDGRFFNKRTEMLFEAVQWVKDGGCLPHCPELIEEMTAVTYTFKGDKFLCEDKDQVKVKIGRSTDYFDAFGLTFAHPVAPHSMSYEIEAMRRRRASHSDDPRMAILGG